ncbi:MAG: hypothetical protein LBD46_05215 [Endomicrobium sp.]|jgi:hypothetical protein|nr:hypothetical protein [Endomicrobium sp.]
MIKEFFTRKDLAERWCCTPQHVSNMVRNEEIPAPIPISKRVNIWKAEDIVRIEKEKQRKAEIKLQPILKAGG